MKDLLLRIRKFAPLFFAVFFFSLIPELANAQVGLIASFAASAVGEIIFALSYIVSYIGGIAIAILSWFVGIIIEVGANPALVNSTVVKAGFPVVLSLANLGFVLGIIVIGIMTILRSQTYGVKQILWKLIVMAIMVNFGLVICGVILNFSDRLTIYFLESVQDPSGTSGGNPWKAAATFSSALTGAFQPQKGILAGTQIKGGTDATVFQGIASDIGKKLSKLLTPITSLIFVVFMLVFICITLATLFLMLLIRYVYLSFLLVVLPIAWVSWVFPTFKSNWDRWWGVFLRWAFFPPIVLFFLWLAIQTSYQMDKGGGLDFTTQFTKNQPADSAWNVIQSGLTGLFSGIAVQLLETAVILGIVLGGIMMANAMGIKFADAAQKAAYGASRSFGGYVGNRAKSLGYSVTDRAKTAGRQFNPATRETTTTLQRVGSRLQGIPGLKGVGSLIARQGATTSTARAEAIETMRKKELMPLDNEGLIARATSRTALLNPSSAAAMGQELARRNLTNDPRVAPVLQNLVETAERMGNAQSIYNNDPRLVQRRRDASGTFVETQEEAIQRAVRNIKNEVAQVDHHALGDHANPAAIPTSQQNSVVLNISNPQLGKLGADGTAEQIEAFRNSVRQISDQFTGGTLHLAPAEQESLRRILDYTDASPAWQNII